MNPIVSAVLCALAMGGVLLKAGPAVPSAEQVQGAFAAEGQKAALGHGLAWVDAKGGISVGFFAAELDAKDRARAMAGGGAIYGVFDQPNVTLDISLKDGAGQPALATFEACHVAFHGFTEGPFDLNAFGQQCGPVELSGALTPGGVVHGRFKGQAEAYPHPDGHRPLYTWDLTFTATLRAKP